MKTLRLSLLLLVLFSAAMAPSPARADFAVSFDFFYDSLAPYGDWIDVGEYGLCWTPSGVDPDWTPYSDGYFAFTDGGWTWVSYEEFGGIVYHYGRWIHLYDGRWCWKPDYEWAPAWVSWRHSPDYIGWAPLPPEARWRRNVGFGIWVDSEYDLGPGYYNFCRPRDFGAPVLRRVIIDRSQNVTIIRETVNITNITYNAGYEGGPVIYVGGPDFTEINLIVERPIPALKLVRNANFDAAHWRDHRGPGGRLGFNEQMLGNELIVAAPLVAAPRDFSAFKSKKTIGTDKVSKGWGLVKDPAMVKELRQELHRQSKGLTPDSAPARAIGATDLKGVPATGDPHATMPTTLDRHEKTGKNARPEGIARQPAVAPATVPPTTPVAGNSKLKPFNPPNEPKQSSSAPVGIVKPIPNGVGSTVPAKGGRSHSADEEQARIRAEQERSAQQKQAELAAQQQKQIAAQQEAAKMQMEEKRRIELQQQQKVQGQRALDARHAMEAEREHQKLQSENQRGAQPQPHGNQPPVVLPQPRGKGSPSKDNKDKDKDKNGN